MKKNKNVQDNAMDFNVVNVDKDGNAINEAFPVSERTQKDHRKTSVGFTLISFILHVLAFVPIVAVTAILAAKCGELTPYYSFWPFVGLIIVLVFALIYAIVAIVVMRKNSKSSVGTQTVKIAITFACLTAVFALLLTYILPDVIAKATQNTLFVEDLYYNGEAQAEKNAKLDRDFIMYNLLNGNLNDHTKDNGTYSYKELSKRTKNGSGVWSYDNAEINANYEIYKQYSVSQLQTDVIDVLKQKSPRKYELYQFVYNSYVLNDFDYAMLNNVDRRALALSIVDYEYSNARYEKLLKEGFKNKKIKQLFDKNYDQFNQDGYQTFDDPLLLYAQMDGRMTVPVVIRLILNEGWMYSQPVFDANGNCYFDENNTFLYELYDPATRDKFVKEENGKFDFTGTLMNGDGSEIPVKYGYNKDGWMVYENGVVKRTINWLVLDMLGDKMDLTTVDLIGTIMGIIPADFPLPPAAVKNILNKILGMGDLTGALGDLLQEDLQEVLEYATNGANLNIGLYMDDNDCLAVNIYPMNVEYGMVGYMQATWIQSNNLLMAVINVMGLRNWLCIFGAVGIVLVIAAGICRECGRRTRLRTEVSRDRIARAKTIEKNNNPEVVSDIAITPAVSDNQTTVAPADVSVGTAPAESTKADDAPTAETAATQPEVFMAEEVKPKKKKKRPEAPVAEPMNEVAPTVAAEPVQPVAESAIMTPPPVSAPAAAPYDFATAEPLMAEEAPQRPKKKKKRPEATEITTDNASTPEAPVDSAVVNAEATEVTAMPTEGGEPQSDGVLAAEEVKPKKKKKVEQQTPDGEIK